MRPIIFLLAWLSLLLCAEAKPRKRMATTQQCYAHFDTSNEYLQALGLPLGDYITLEAFVRVNEASNGSQEYLFGRGDAINTRLRFDGEGTATGRIVALFQLNAGPLTLTSSILNVGQWYHVAFAAGSGSLSSLYINGVINVVGSSDALDDSETHFVMGNRKAGQSVGAKCDLRDVILWNIARKSWQISQTASGQIGSVPQPGMLGYWPLETDGNAAFGPNAATSTPPSFECDDIVSALECNPAIECCGPNIYEYQSADANSSGQCARTAPDCSQVPSITIYPPSGSQIAQPTYIVLTSSVDGAVIRYTLDGTEPNEFSTLYTVPFQISSPNVIIKASAQVEGCTAGPIEVARYTNPTFPFVFSYACDTPDKGGPWGVFAPNGNPDWHWQFQFTTPGGITIARLELYQLDLNGNWTTGQVWSTNSPITTPSEFANPFSCFPLLVFIGGVQQWVAYQSSLVAPAAGTYTWDLYGETAYAAPANNFFRLDIILSDGTRFSQTIGATCTAAPPICPPPSAPVLTPTCGSGGSPAIDTAFTVGLGLAWILYRATGAGEFDQVATGTGTGALQTVTDGGLSEGVTYYYYLSVDLAGCGFKDSNIVSALSLTYATVNITTDKAVVDPGETFTLSWSSNRLYTTVCNGCLAGQIKTPFGCKAGNTSGSQSTSEAVCGIYTYEVSGCNPCGTVVDSVQVEVRCTATCSGTQPDSIQIPDSTTYLCSFLDTDFRICDSIAYDDVCGTPVWDGRLYLNGTCFYRAPSFDLGLQFGCCDLGTGCGPRCGSDIICYFDGSVPAWFLKIAIHSGSGVGPEWIGRKLYGNNPVGTYTKLSGCGPASITVS